MNGKLYLVSTPIGNYDDITLRALNVLKSADFIICEEYREARRLLSHYQIEKELHSLNEHNEQEGINDLLLRFVNGESAALISDCGTPLFSDPGHLLVDVCISQKIEVIPVPGASSLMPALIGSGFDFEKFYFYGWLSPKKDERRLELQKLRSINSVIVLMDTPYRLKTLMADVAKAFGPGTRVSLAYELTMKGEKFYRGSASEILSIAETKNLKGEFVLVVNNSSGSRVQSPGSRKRS
ncbi:MAG: 16S rRNA (cytidine(1402)-2'-O)-methyltransferase [Syntrophothermus sp.]